MPRMSKADAAVSLDEPEIEGRYAELGEYTVAFETHKADMDPAPFFRGLPDDRCQCPHWGYVLRGSISFGYDDHVEVFETGDAFYVPGGHGNAVKGGTEVIMFSPTADLALTEAAIQRNMAAMQPH